MGRKRAREWVVKFLFQLDLRDDDDYKALLEQFLEDNPIKTDEGAYLRENAEGVIDNMGEIDELIKDKLVNWTIDRIPKIDLAILRNALYEILYRRDIPVRVAINEAVEIAKKYSNSDSGTFVNGILGRIVRERNLT